MLSWKRFTAQQPNQLWQADVTHWRLADHTEVEILDLIDDHSRLAIASTARAVTTGPMSWTPSWRRSPPGAHRPGC